MLIADAEQGQSLGFQIGIQTGEAEAFWSEIPVDELMDAAQW